MMDSIILGDCLDKMKCLADGSVDLVLTDPPYGLKESCGKNKSRGKLAVAKDYGNKNWDMNIPDKVYFDEIMRISKNQIIFGGNYFIEYLKNSPCWIVWDKNNGNSDFADCELAWTSFKSAVRLFKWTWAGMLQENMANKETRYHPTQKPVGLIEKILLKYSKEGDLILDPFAGSGTTAVACINLNRHFIGIEKEAEYVEIANKRIEQARLDKESQPTLFEKVAD